MSRANEIEKRCEGKAVRIFSARNETQTVSFVETYRNCGRKSCIRCRVKRARPHGPYWNLNFTDENGKPRTLYVGRNLPALAHRFSKVSYADVLRYHEENETSKAAIGRQQEQIKKMRNTIEELYEQIRILSRPSRKKTSERAEKFFKQLALKYHPDRTRGSFFSAEDVMKDINQLFDLARI